MSNFGAYAAYGYKQWEDVGNALDFENLKEQEAIELFHCIDEDNSGYVDEFELRRYLKKKGLQLTTVDTELLSNTILEGDLNSDGLLSLDEFVTICQKMRNHIKLLRRFESSVTSEESFYHFSNKIAGWLLCFCGGYVDTGGYLLLKGIFVASAPGNFVKVAINLVEGNFQVLWALAVILSSYACGSGIIRAISIIIRARQKIDLQLLAIYLFSIEIIVLLLSILVGKLLQSRIEVEMNYQNWPVMIEGICLGISMGAQVGAISCCFAKFPNTTGMTSFVAGFGSIFTNIILIYIHIFKLSFEKNNQIKNEDYITLNNISEKFNPEEAMKKLQANWQASKKILQKELDQGYMELDQCLRPLLFFFIGCIVSALVTKRINYYSFFIPTFIVIWLVIELYWKRYLKINRKCDNNDESNLLLVVADNEKNIQIDETNENIVNIDNMQSSIIIDNNNNNNDSNDDKIDQIENQHTNNESYHKTTNNNTIDNTFS